MRKAMQEKLGDDAEEVSASVFVNKGDNGSYRTVSLQRRYKVGNDWKSSMSYRLSHLPAAIAVLQMAINHVAERETASED